MGIAELLGVLVLFFAKAIRSIGCVRAALLRMYEASVQVNEAASVIKNLRAVGDKLFGFRLLVLKTTTRM